MAIQEFQIVQVFTDPPAGKDDVVITKLAPSVFVLDNGDADVWCEILVSSVGEQRQIESVMIGMARPVEGIRCTSELFKEDNHTTEPEWAAMFRGFRWVDQSNGVFSCIVGDGTDPLTVCPCDATVDLQPSPAAYAPLGAYYLIRPKQPATIGPSGHGKNSKSASFYLNWQDRSLCDPIDGSTLSYNYVWGTDTALLHRVVGIYSHVVLPRDTVLTGSMSKPEVRLFNPRRVRRMFRTWRKVHSLEDSRDVRLTRVDTEAKIDSGIALYSDYLFSNATIMFRKQRDRTVLAEYVEGIGVGLCLGLAANLLVMYVPAIFNHVARTLPSLTEAVICVAIAFIVLVTSLPFFVWRARRRLTWRTGVK